MQGDTKSSIEFLKKFAPKGPWVLTAIAVDRKQISTNTYRPETIKQCENFIDKYNGERNIYFSVNEVMYDVASKAQKTDIKQANWLHVDIDPIDGQPVDSEQDRILSRLTSKLPKGIPEPTVIVYSGGGFQAFWRLMDPVVVEGNVQKGEEFELYNKRLESIFGGDHCFNIDRIMRLPGTVNVPDAKKMKKGRVKALAKLIEFNKKRYPIEEFKKATAVQTSSSALGGADDGYGAEVDIPGNIERVQDLSELDEWSVPDRVKIIIAQGHHPDQPKEKDNSRSAWVFDCVCSLVRCGVPDATIYAILTDPDWGIASSVVELRGGADRYARRQIKRAKEYSEDPNLVRLNDQHAVIGNIAGKCRVIEEVEDDILGRSKLTISSFQDFQHRYQHIKVKVGENKEGAPIKMALGKYWLEHPMRRQYDTMRFMPNGDKTGVYNLWRGFNVEPIPGGCELYLKHLRENICDGNEEHFQYLIKWMARTVQYPASQGEVAVVLRGAKGAGKGMMMKYFGRIFGRHYLQIANASHLVGNFNSHLQDVVLLFADEAFFAGDKKHESVLKMLVTEDTIPIEKKGIDVEAQKNYIHIVMASNDPHVVRATGDERRYYVLNVGENKKQNTEFFGELADEMDNGGCEALLYYLQNVDLQGFNVRNVPQTDALKEQKLLSLNTDEEWWYRKLQAGRILEEHVKWEKSALTDDVSKDYIKYADLWNFNRRGNETQLGKFLHRVCPHLTKPQRKHTVDVMDRDGHHSRQTTRSSFYDFGSLKQCRDSWEKIYGDQEWPDSELDLDTGEVDVPF